MKEDVKLTVFLTLTLSHFFLLLLFFMDKCIKISLTVKM